MMSKFWQLPVAVKLVVIWFFLLGLNSFWRSGIDIGTRHILDLEPLLRGIIEWGLAIGLVRKSNGSRVWAAFFTALGSLAVFWALVFLIFEDTIPIKDLQLQISMPKNEAIILLVAFLILNTGILITLMRHATKALFVPQTNQEIKQ